MKHKRLSPAEMEAARLRLHQVLTMHIGPDRKIGMGELYQRVFDRPWGNRINDTKILRRLITEMRDNGLPVMSSQSTSNGGYWLSASASELNDYCDKEKRAALKRLKRIACMKKVSLPQFLGQLQLEMEPRDG